MDCIFHLCSFLVLECKWYFGLFQRGFVCSLHKWLMQSNPIARWHICQGSINGLSFSPDGKYLATVGRDGMSVPLSFLFHTCRSSPWVSDAHFIWQSHTSFLECPSTENWHTCPFGYRSWQCGGSLHYSFRGELYSERKAVGYLQNCCITGLDDECDCIIFMINANLVCKVGSHGISHINRWPSHSI